MCNLFKVLLHQTVVAEFRNEANEFFSNILCYTDGKILDIYICSYIVLEDGNVNYNILEGVSLQ